MGHRRSYSWEFKLQMIQLLEKGELNPSQISRDHHVTRSLLYVWWQLYRERGQAATRGPSPARVGRGGSLDRLRGLCGTAWPLRLRQVHAAAHPGGHALPINAAHFLIEVAHPRWQLLWRHAPPEGGQKADHQVDSSSRRAGFPQIGNRLPQRFRVGLLKQIELQRGV